MGRPFHPSEADIVRLSRHVQKVPILLQQSKIKMLGKSRESWTFLPPQGAGVLT
jgi:hypothetical protein